MIVTKDIETSGTYSVPSDFRGELRIAPGISVSIEDPVCSGEVDVVLLDGSSCTYLGYISDEHVVRRFFAHGKDASVDARFLTVGERNKSVFDVALSGEGSAASVKSLVLLREGARSDCEATIRAVPTGSFTNGEFLAESVTGSLELRNLFLGESAHVRSLPRLYVASDAASASHAASFERISDSELFFLMMRGMSRDEARRFLVEAKIRALFSSCDGCEYECDSAYVQDPSFVDI